MRKDAEKTVYLIENETTEAALDKVDKPVITRTDETREILGKTCHKVLVEVSQEGTTMNQVIWITKELKVPAANNDKVRQLTNGVTAYPELEGFPMLVEVAIPNTAVTMKLEVSDMTEGKIDRSLLTYPEDYQKKSMKEMLQSGF